MAVGGTTAPEQTSRPEPPVALPRPTPMRTPRTVCGAVVVAGLLGLGPAPDAAASCVGPVLGVGAVPSPDAQLVQPVLDLASGATVAGEWFREGCDDTGQRSGCGAPPREEAPLEDVELVLEQGTTTAVLGTGDATDRDERYAVAWPVEVPDGFRQGPAVLRAASAVLDVELR